MGGPPLVSPNRVKVGGSDVNDDDAIVTVTDRMAPCPRIYISVNNMYSNS